MSLICLGFVDKIEKSEIAVYTQELEILAKRHKRRVKFYVDWDEPIVSYIKQDSFIINILDGPESDNCELLLLPDGWYINGRTDELLFRERIKFLEDIANIFIKNQCCIELYLGLSGTLPDEFFNVKLRNSDLVEYLITTIGVFGLDNAVHISVVP